MANGLDLGEGIELSATTTRLSVKNNVFNRHIIRFIGLLSRRTLKPHDRRKIEVERTLDAGVFEINSMTGRVDIIGDGERHNAFNLSRR